ncbi:MAG: DUF72 domain-containing protein [Candidatus Bathyarchaeia archaeon]|jgi:uncharacterized protein YecE (DUF72 family)
MTVHAGTIGWSYNFWKGPFYPAKLPNTKLLSFYATQFNTVEVDNTFYRIPNPQTMLNWKQQTPDNFIFSLKFPNLITHVKMLKDCQRETAIFLERAQLLDKKLGPMLLQFPPSFGEAHFSDLAVFLSGLPRGLRFVVEVRNKSLMNERLFEVLKGNNIALAWVDSPIMPSSLELTSDFVYLRLEGDRSKVQGVLGTVEVDRQADVKVWAEKLAVFKARGVEVFGYFGKFYSGFPPLDVRRFLEDMGVGYQKTLL